MGVAASVRGFYRTRVPKPTHLYLPTLRSHMTPITQSMSVPTKVASESELSLELGSPAMSAQAATPSLA